MVIFENEYSNEIEFKNGVPQGSPLSSLLFNIYMRDLKNIDKINISQFADDMVVWEAGNSIDRIERDLNSKLKKISEFITSIDL